MTLEKLKRIIKNLPELEINRAVIAVENNIYTWKECREIIEKDENSELAKKIIEKLEELTK